MRFTPTPLQDAFAIDIEPFADERGFFTRTFCGREFAARSLPGHIVQTSLSHNKHRGTIRGMHLQLPPSREGKLVSCIRGAIHDVIVDLRPQSKTFLQHFAIELQAHTHNALFIPPLMAHGFQTLEDETEVLYQMTDFYAPELSMGWRWDDPAFAIRWPLGKPSTILARDEQYPDFDAQAYKQRLTGQ